MIPDMDTVDYAESVRFIHVVPVIPRLHVAGLEWLVFAGLLFVVRRDGPNGISSRPGCCVHDASPMRIHSLNNAVKA